ncbi:MAG: Hpt domain-containing protein [Coriobacteriales bacterium]|nr:Hpt domain-containing protein [Coriobacteriales bacterium]
MTLQELYANIDADYAEAIGRLRMDKLISRFIVRFMSDSSCERVQEAWARGDEAGTFEAAHAAKGVCANLALTKLGSLASDICEALRPGNDALRASTDVDALVAELSQVYDKTIAAIKAYQASL